MISVIQSFTIEGNIVELVTQFSDIKVYKYQSEEEDVAILYFTKNDAVVKSLHIGADCGQDQGYISELQFKEVK